MERKPEGLEDTLAVTPGAAMSETRITVDEPSTAPTLIAGASDAPGAAVPSNRYRLGELLGRGGMGEVLTARDQQISRSVAIKRLRGDASEIAVSRFLREAKIQGQLDHPAIVPVHELCRDEAGRPYFVMKQLSGRTLADVLGSDDPALLATFNRQTLLRAFVDVCLAVEFAHTRGVIHRDLKPANIMLGDFGEVYVLDWGIARLVGETSERTSLAELEVPDAATVAGAVLGTPGYMSPEQIRGEVDLDGRADVFALGCILFEILTRSPLYPRGVAALTDTLAGADARPTLRSADVAPELDAPCVDAAATERARRTKTARELGEQVQRYLDGDRDLALRKTLAKDELARAQAAFERGGIDDRRIAMQSAGRALALDPHAKEPAQLVGRLMLEPPTQIPPEVDRAIAKSEHHLVGQALRTSNLAMLSYMALFPLSLFAGIDQLWFLTIGPLLLGMIFTASLLSSRAVAAHRPYARYFLAGFTLHCVLVGVISHALSPFLVSPALIAMMVMVFASNSRVGHPGFLIAGGIIAILLPLALELAGVVRQTVSFEGTRMLAEPTGFPIDPERSMVAMVIFVIAVVIASVLLSRSQALERDQLHKRLEVQAWQLRQLVPQ